MFFPNKKFNSFGLGFVRLSMKLDFVLLGIKLTRRMILMSAWPSDFSLAAGDIVHQFCRMNQLSY